MRKLFLAGLAMSEVKLKVADVATPSPLKARPEATVREAASMMAAEDQSCVIVVDKEERPIGIVTEGDLVSRVLAKGLKPDEVKLEEVMSKPLITVKPTDSAVDALRIMAKMRVRHLVVMERGRLRGIVTDRDIVRVAPALVEILTERASMMEGPPTIKEGLAGYCDSCGEWSDNLVQIDDQMLCEECRLEYGIERA
ncbi:MAG: inosine-5-monophosphate dehydrogenase [Thermoprotei archaeon]|nr:MAG: inosine-5-monophosphate dehydrogenase [Thermoprotei archaeon]